MKKTGEYDRLNRKWFGVLDPQGIPFRKLILYLALMLIPLLLALAGQVFWSWSLRKQVGQKTEELYHELLEHQHAQEALRESEARYRTLVENIDMGISLINSDYQIVMTNIARDRSDAKPSCEFVDRVCFEKKK